MLLASASCEMQILLFCFQMLMQKELDISGVATLHIPAPAGTIPLDQRFIDLRQPQLPHPAVTRGCHPTRCAAQPFLCLSKPNPQKMGLQELQISP